MSVYAYGLANYIVPEKDYSYEAKAGTCRYPKNYNKTTIAGCKIILKNNATAIKEHLQNGPVVISIDSRAVPIKFAPKGK